MYKKGFDINWPTMEDMPPNQTKTQETKSTEIV